MLEIYTHIYNLFIIYIIYLFIWLCHAACGTLVPQPVYVFVCVCIYLFDCAMQFVGSQFPNQGLYVGRQ